MVLYYYNTNMQYLQKVFFFRCYHCGEWYYSNKIIKVKKCWKCTKSFQFKKSAKFTKTCTLQEAINLIKKLKEKVQEVSLTKYINSGRDIRANFELKK
jgi:uncharacterized protein (DUF983 family)